MNKKIRWLLFIVMLAGSLAFFAWTQTTTNQSAEHHASLGPSENGKIKQSATQKEMQASPGGASIQIGGTDPYRNLTGDTSVDGLIKSFHRWTNREEKKLILHDIARSYRFFQKHADNEKIRALLKDIVYRSDDPEFVSLAASLYGRLEIHEDTVDVLYFARSKDVWTDDDLYAEMAFLIIEEALFRPQRALDVMRKAIDNNSEMTRIRLISQAGSPVFLQNASDVMKNEMLSYVLRSKPTFGDDYALAGISDMVHYEQWMAAIMNIKTDLTGSEPAQAFADHLKKNPIEDHREAIVIFQHRIFGELSSVSGGVPIKTQIEDMVGAYADSYPNNALVKDIDPQKLEPLIERHQAKMAALLKGK